MSTPPCLLGLTRWEWMDGGTAFRVWARPVIGEQGRRVVPVTLLWRRADGSSGIAHCAGLIEAMERAARLAAGPGG